MCVGDFMKLTKKIKKILHSEEVKRFSKKVKTLFKKSKTYINKKHRINIRYKKKKQQATLILSKSLKA